MSIRVSVLIRPKNGVRDPQGDAVERALSGLGFDTAENVRVGRLVELTVDDVDRVEEMCERLIVNSLIEDYEIKVVEE